MVQAMQHVIRCLVRRVVRRGVFVLGLAALASGALANEIYVVQLASVKSEARATDAWIRLKDRHVELLGDLQLMLQRVDLGERGIFFRMQTGPFPNLATAQDMCRQFKAADLDCIVAER